MADIPRPDADFNTYAGLVITYITNNLAHFGFTAPDIVPLTDAKTVWDTEYSAHQLAQASIKGVTQSKDDARFLKPAGLEPQIRSFRKRIDSLPQTTNAERELFLLAVEGEPAFAAVASPPESRPVVTIDTKARLEHKLRWTDEASGKKAKPPGVKEAEIYFIVTAEGAAIPPVEQFAYLGRDTESPYTKEFLSPDAGKVANYIARWIHRDGSHGSWSEIARATIVG